FNNDAITEPDRLTKLVEACEADPEIGLISPLLRDGPDVQGYQLGCGLFDLSVPSFDLIFDLQEALGAQIKFASRFAVVGTALFIPRTTIEKIGVLDDRFFAYWEDVDYSIRSIAAGLKNVLASNSV